MTGPTMARAFRIDRDRLTPVRIARCRGCGRERPTYDASATAPIGSRMCGECCTARRIPTFYAPRGRS